MKKRWIVLGALVVIGAVEMGLISANAVGLGGGKPDSLAMLPAIAQRSAAALPSAGGQALSANGPAVPESPPVSPPSPPLAADRFFGKVTVNGVPASPGTNVTATIDHLVSPPESPPVSPPESPPVSPPESPPVSPPESPPVSPPESPPVSPPESPPVSPPESPPASPPSPPSVCGQTTVTADSMYVLDVVSSEDTWGCGTEGATVNFTVDGCPAGTATWHSGQFTSLTLAAGCSPPESPPVSPPVATDTDGDGCTDAQELAQPNDGLAPLLPGETGGFNPNAWYDFYDVPAPVFNDPRPNGPRNKSINVQDVVSLLKYVGTYLNGPPVGGKDYDSDKGVDTNGDGIAEIPPDGIPDGLNYDRLPSPLPNPPWDAGPPDGFVNVQDVSVMLHQVGLGCSTP